MFIYQTKGTKLIFTTFILLLGLIGSFVAVRVVSANGFANCFVWTNEGWVEGGSIEFESCATLVRDDADVAARDLYTGVWGNYSVLVDADSNVYYRFFRRGQFRYWGQLAPVAVEADEPAESDPLPEPTTEAAVVPQNSGADLDRDGFAGDADRCPEEREIVNGIFDNDGCPDDMDDLINFAIQDLNAFWEEETSALGATYYPPNRVQKYSNPSNPRLRFNAFYAPYGHYIAYDIALMDRALSSFGDYAPVAIMAHEWAHLSQRNLGINRDYTISLELQADCLAGAYTFHLQEQGNLEEGDLEEGAFQMYSIGDPSGTPWFHDNAHGTGEQRYDAFLAGFEEGIEHCVATY